MSQNVYDLKPRWYVIHTYTGYEKKVKENLEKMIKNRELQDYFFDIVVPMEEKIEIKDGKRKSSLKKVFPGYIIIKMIVTEETWYIVRNTTGVTGFVGSGTTPIPLTKEEIRKMGIEKNDENLNLKLDDKVNLINGAFAGKTGIVTEVNNEKQTAKVLLSLFGRETPVDVKFEDIEKIKKVFDLKVNDNVKLLNGAFEGKTGKITEVDDAKEQVKITLSIFGKETPVVVNFNDVEKVKE